MRLCAESFAGLRQIASEIGTNLLTAFCLARRDKEYIMSRRTKPEPNEPSGKEVQFRCVAQEAQSVCLAGTFNNWDPASMPMRQMEAGDWLVVIQLPPGRHQYKYVGNGIWCCVPGVDDGCYSGEDAVANAFGTHNRVITVE
jgi:AMP-activated protein kinase-like protein